jgi:TetR/AcrR family transcriptional regulator of autoinduction and epiphytic fitness
MVPAVGETNVTDRRIERANRTRDNVVDALLALIEEGNLRPTAREIASRAGVSLRSLYVHFDDVEALFHAAAIRHGLRVQENRGELVTTGSFEERLAAFIDRRIQHYQSDRNVRQAALLQEPFSPALHSILEAAREAGRAELDKVFAPELSGRDGPNRRAALDVVTHPASWKVMRSQHGLDVETARALVARMVRDVLGQDHPPTAGTGGNGRKAARKT